MSHAQGGTPQKEPFFSPTEQAALFEFDLGTIVLVWPLVENFQHPAEDWISTLFKQRPEINMIYHLAEDRQVLGVSHREVAQ